ncbi:ketopantoate hydroxymethyltransferase [Aspergillus ambiguus]|uniref:3-methyl-2-oxobutanoate hydroxymethyltransferase n=1 Tax=Aspergillus ambiguus TaxID=176160 RepID=UPI003CCD85E3
MSFRKDDTPSRKAVTVQTIRRLYNKGEPLTALTAYDFSSGLLADAAGAEIILIGDSLAMVALGSEDTTELTLDEMIIHCRSVSRAVKNAFTIGDLPMGSYERSPEEALGAAIRIVKEGRAKAVKLEGGEEMASTIKHITQAGIPVVAHIGLTPQRQNSLGGFRVQGKSIHAATKLLHDALAVQNSGAIMTVIEAVPSEVAEIVTKRLQIPTIGVGSGNKCSGQILVQQDLLGNFPPSRHLPKFVKQYADIWGHSVRGLEEYMREVKGRDFPSMEHTYPISSENLEDIRRGMELVDGNSDLGN